MTEQLAASREAERNFLLSVSHELKTPLTAIRGYAEGLADGAFGPDEAARTIRVEAGRLERLVRDLLDLARMNRAEFSVRREPVDLAEIAREAVAPARGGGAGVRRRARAAGDGGLGRGATRPAAAGRVEPRRERAARDARGRCGHGRAAEPGLLVVADTGPGIPADDLPHAFERFYLYDKVGKDRPVGSGLGLAIVKQLATAMGGDVSGRERSRPARRSRSRYGRSFEVSTTSKSEPVRRPSACSWSFDQCGLGAPETYQFEPLSARIRPYVFIACATIAPAAAAC